MKFWRKWLRKKRREQERKILEKRGLWGSTPETIQWLIDELKEGDFSGLDYDRRTAISLRTYHPNVDVLAVQINAFVVAIKGDEYVDYPPNLKEQIRTLDAFLVSVRNSPIAPENALKVLIPPVEHLVADLLIMRSEEHEKLGYYLRRGERLLNDVTVFISALVESQDMR